jgi:hypothetical protein
MYPARRSPERAQALQEYLQLHSQREAIEKSLNHITHSHLPFALSRPTSSVRSRAACLSSSETEEICPSPVFPFRQDSMHISQYTQPEVSVTRDNSSGIVDDGILREVEEKEIELHNLRMQIKTTLTNLLNCDGVKHNRRYRMWVQTRLMDTEKELADFKRQSLEKRNAGC